MNALKRYREAQGLNQEELAQKLGTTAATVSRIEAGIRYPSVKLMRQIMTATNGAITPNDFVVQSTPAQPEAAA
jgi:transcriptional regulator with XRE-family HTH domain